MKRLEPGQRIGERYSLVERIGSGGMADVWLADDSMLERQVALKFLHDRFAQDTQFIERFRREASAAAGLQHANVVGVYDRGEWEGRHWIAMEYVEGASLKDLIGRGLSIGEAVEIVRQVLAGTRFAHERGIIHRDLKPHNVLVDSEGRARVADFGIARGGVSEITQTGSVLGTVQYLSPEQAQGLEVSAASDLYSVGVILYEALTGEVPFEADSPVAVALKQVSEQPRPPSELNPAVSRALDAVVLRALAKDPENRFSTADEFLAALDAAEADPEGGGLDDTAAFAPVVTPTAPTALAPPPPPPPEAVAVIEEPVEDRGWLTRNRAIALGVLALLAAAVAVWALTRPETVNVPAVVGDSSFEARTTLEARGFDVLTRPLEACAPEDTVTEQDPPAGSEAEQGSRVVLTVSHGLRVEVPETRGLAEADAAKRITEAELNPDSRKQASRNVDAGRVIGSEPPAGTEVDCESIVVLMVSRGQTLVELPDVLGDSQQAAQAELERLGFLVNVETRDADEPEGTVIGQDPGPGSSLTRGTEVTIVVSTGAGTVIMPNVQGRSEDSARQTLTARGLSVEVVEQETDERSEDERVLAQAPAAGTRLRQGELVEIFVGVFVEPEPTTTTTVPEPTTTTTTPDTETP